MIHPQSPHVLFFILLNLLSVHFRTTAFAHASPNPSIAFTSSNAPIVHGTSSTVITDRLPAPLFTATFSHRSNDTGIARASKCWNEIMTWRHQSVSWYDIHVRNKTWPIGPTSTKRRIPWFSSTTIYPLSVSTYKLCDGSPRANVRPITKHSSGTRTYLDIWNSALMPTFSKSQPCTPDPDTCRIWCYESDIRVHDDNELLIQCGFPTHLGAPCLIGGGPVRLVYFPVSSPPNHLCAHNHSTTAALTTQAAAIETITTLGHTFTSGSVYLSFRTLYASYDGFWDRIGPTFSDYILPLPSSAISTQCGWDAYGPGTPLAYTDLNWPVPASAYSCQNRCSPTLTSTCATCNYYTKPKPPECHTIWSDVNPILAVPTRVREMVPQWSTCSFWDSEIPNFWFDPPIALQEQQWQNGVTSTKDPAPVKTDPAPKSMAMEPLPQNTASMPNGDPGRRSSTMSRNAEKTHGSSEDRRSKVEDPNAKSASSTGEALESDGPQRQGPHTRHVTSTVEKATTRTMEGLSVLAGLLSLNTQLSLDPWSSTVAAAHTTGGSSVQHDPNDSMKSAERSHLTEGRGTSVHASSAIPSASATTGPGRSYSTISFTTLNNDPGVVNTKAADIAVVAAAGVTLTESTLLHGPKPSVVMINGYRLSVDSPAMRISKHVISLGTGGLVLVVDAIESTSLSQSCGSGGTDLPAIVTPSPTGSHTKSGGTTRQTGASPISTLTSNACHIYLSPALLLISFAVAVISSVWIY